MCKIAAKLVTIPLIGSTSHRLFDALRMSDVGHAQLMFGWYFAISEHKKSGKVTKQSMYQLRDVFAVFCLRSELEVLRENKVRRLQNVRAGPSVSRKCPTIPLAARCNLGRTRGFMGFPGEIYFNL